MSSARLRPLLLLVGAIVLIAAGGYLSFELGRDRAGYSLLDERRQTATYEAKIGDLDAELEELRRQLAIFETSREIDRETYTQVEVNLGQLQSKIQAQEEELAFYRGIVSPEDGVAGLKVQSLEVLPSDPEKTQLLRLVLVQTIVHNRIVSGLARVRLLGMREGEPAQYDLEQLAPEDADDGMAYEFRYFQSFEQEIRLPVGFEPATVEVEIWPTEPRGEPVTESFAWSAVHG
jgi:hypothetical protein